MRTDSGDESLKSDNGSQGESSIQKDFQLLNSSDASSRQSSFSMRVKGRKLGSIGSKKKLAQLNNLVSDLQPIQEMRNENRGANKREVPDQLRQGMDTDSLTEDSRGSSTETLSANQDQLIFLESPSQDDSDNQLEAEEEKTRSL